MPSPKSPTPQQGFFDFTVAERVVERSVTIEVSESPRRELATEPKSFTVSEIVRSASRTLEARFADVWVEGEVSNLSMPRSGHFYFTLKDESAQLPAVMFRTQAARLKFAIEN